MTQRYELQLRGHLALEWSNWLENLSITHTEDGRTILIGSVADQAALHGLLARLGSLGVPILRLICLGAPTDDV